MTITSPSLIDVAPGNTVTIVGSGFGTSGSLSVNNQGADGTGNTVITASSWTATALSFIVPDGLLSGTLTVTAQDTTTGTVSLRVCSQYVQASEYIAEGTDLSDLNPGELDSILRKASAYADSWIGHPLRWMQTKEQSPWINGRRVYPRNNPINTVDSLLVRISNNLTATINPQDCVINKDNRYFEILSYAVAAYSFAQAIMNIGLSANIVEYEYTHGFKMLDYPQEVREAVKMIATELLTYRRIQASGFGGYSQVKQGQQVFQRRNEPFAIPQPALELLRPWKRFRLK